jgi:hypothetical protein
MGEDWTSPEGTGRNHSLGGEWICEGDAMVTVSMSVAMDAFDSNDFRQ